jgi:glycerol-3-phosphate dehydrogenase
MSDLGRMFGGDLTEAEVNYLMDQEWAVAAEDVLWRRTKLGLKLDVESVQALEAYMQERRSARAAAQ